MILFESHATSVDNEKGIASGQLDSPLSKKGKLQAEELGKRYEGDPIELIYTSDLIRSKETAEIAFKGRNIPMMHDPRLREWNYGTYNGALTSEVEQKKRDYIYTPFPDGESLKGALLRITAVMDEMNHKRALIIGHRAVFYALEYRFKNISLEELVTRPWAWQPGWIYSLGIK